MRRLLAILGVLTLAGIAGLAVAGGTGYALKLALPADGELAIVNTQANLVWRPCLVSVVCPDVAMRTVSVYRVTGAMAYPLAQKVVAAQTYIYEFQANYWCGVSNGVKVTVSPACTGTVEVIYE